MQTLESTPAATDAEFRTRLLRFINETLPRLDRRQRAWHSVVADTALFASGLLDSLSILHLIAAVETLAARPVPDRLVVMNHFQTVNAITAAFGPSAQEDEQ
jgi:acyl carrier protein